MVVGERSAVACGGGSASDTTRPVAGSDASPSLQHQFVAVVKAVSPSVVQIRTSFGRGSGVVFDDQGDIVTNAHVVGVGKRPVVSLSGGDSHLASVVGRAPQNDLAVIRVEDVRPHPATFADSSNVQVGDIAVAIGNPLGLRSSVTQAIVSAVRQRVPDGNGAILPSVIQTSAEINPGNSGGALVDISGRAIGIPTLAAINPEMGSQARRDRLRDRQQHRVPDHGQPARLAVSERAARRRPFLELLFPAPASARGGSGRSVRRYPGRTGPGARCSSRPSRR